MADEGVPHPDNQSPGKTSHGAPGEPEPELTEDSQPEVETAALETAATVPAGVPEPRAVAPGVEAMPPETSPNVEPVVEPAAEDPEPEAALPIVPSDAETAALPDDPEPLVGAVPEPEPATVADNPDVAPEPEPELAPAPAASPAVTAEATKPAAGCLMLLTLLFSLACTLVFCVPYLVR